MAIRRGEIAGVRSHSEVASTHQGKAESGDRAMHGGDYRMGHPIDRFYRRMHSLHDTGERLLALRGQRAQTCGERPDISARHEMPSRPARPDTGARGAARGRPPPRSAADPPYTSARHEMPSRPANDDAAHAVVA